MSKILVFLPHRVWHRILCLGHVLTIRGMCPSRRRQWADFLVPLAAPLHRQYKTARTETRWHLLLKIGQMPTQTSASRGYVLFSGVDKGHTRKPLNCLRSADTSRGVLKTWKDTDHRGCQTRCGLEIPDFAIRMIVSGCILKRQKTFTSSGHCSLPPPLLAVCLFLCICVAGIFVKVRLHVNTAVRIARDIFSEVIVVARQDGI